MRTTEEVALERVISDFWAAEALRLRAPADDGYVGGDWGIWDGAAGVPERRMLGVPGIVRWHAHKRCA